MFYLNNKRILILEEGGSVFKHSCMKNIYVFLILVSVFVMQSCGSAKRMQKNLDKYCPLCPSETTTVIEYRDTTIEIPGETVTVVDSVYCDSLGNVYSIRLSEKDGELIRLKTQLSKNKYTVIAKVDTVYKVIEGNTIYKTKVKTIKVKEKYIPGFVSFLAWTGAIFLILFLIYIIYKRLKSKIP